MLLSVAESLGEQFGSAANENRSLPEGFVNNYEYVSPEEIVDILSFAGACRDDTVMLLTLLGQLQRGIPGMTTPLRNDGEAFTRYEHLREIFLGQAEANLSMAEPAFVEAVMDTLDLAR